MRWRYERVVAARVTLCRYECVYTDADVERRRHAAAIRHAIAATLLARRRAACCCAAHARH